VLIIIAGLVGAFIGRAMPGDAPDVGDAPEAQANPIASSVPAVLIPSDQSCEVERSEISSTKTRLAICKAFNTEVYPEAIPSGVSAADPPGDASEIRERRRRLDSYSEAVIVQHFDGRTGVYKPDEWPIDGDGIIIARKLPSGDIAWYAGPDAGPRSDPAAFRIPPARDIDDAVIDRAPDGTILINGKPADNAVQRMFGGKVRPEQEDAP
jgi:hypothetical protein